MEREISSVATLGIVMIALAVVITLGFGVFSIAKGLANDGVTKVEDSLHTVSLSEFQDYDQKIVTGTKLKSCYHDFEGKAYSILINTSLMDDTANTSDISAISSKTNVIKFDGHNVINYNCVFDSPTNNDLVYDADKGFLRCDKGFKADAAAGDGLKYYNRVSNFTKSGTMEYIPSSARFKSYLVKDKTGTIAGMMFIQLQSN